MKDTIDRIFAGRNFGDLSGYQTGEIKRALSAAYRAGRNGMRAKRELDLPKCPRCEVDRQLLYRCPHCQSLESASR
jgi:hypothetical protein